MIRQLCPHCLKLAELPDGSAGSTVNCPQCGKAFAVPSNYIPSVDPQAGPGTDPRKSSSALSVSPPAPEVPAPPPGYVPQPPVAPTTTASHLPPTAEPTAPPAGPTGYTHDWGIPLSPKILQWIPASCLTIILLLTIFPWVGTYPGGTRVYSQYPWQAVFGNFDRNTAVEEVLKDEAALDEKIGWNLWLIVYLPLLLATIFLAWVERFIHDPTPTTVPAILAWVPSIWQSRFRLLTGLTLLLFLLLLMQLWAGFSLEVAVNRIVMDKFVEEIPKATTTPAKQRLSVQIGQELATKGLQGTTVLSLVLVLHVMAVVVMLLRWWEQRRPANSPTPWVGVRF